MGFDFISRLLFPTPPASYAIDSFPEELIWVPKTLDPKTATAEDCIPCLLLPYTSARFLVFYLHSNAEDLGRCHAFCSSIRTQFQVHVLAVEYPGYGICPGGPCDEQRAVENAVTAFRFAHEILQWPLDSIILLGRSIGCGPAISLAVRYQVSGVVVISPMLSVREICKDLLGPLSYGVKERFPNKDRVPLMSSPFLVVHGQKDTIIPCRHGVELHKACRSRKLLVCPQDMEHNTNLLADISYLVLPMLQFFSLPDYCFEEMNVPSWVYDKRMCPYYNEMVPAQLSVPHSFQQTEVPVSRSKPFVEGSIANCWNVPRNGSSMLDGQAAIEDGDRGYLKFPGSATLASMLFGCDGFRHEADTDHNDNPKKMAPKRYTHLCGYLPYQDYETDKRSSSPREAPRTHNGPGPSVVLPSPSPPHCEAASDEVLANSRVPTLSIEDVQMLKRIEDAKPPKAEPSLLQRSLGTPPVMQYRTASRNRFQAPGSMGHWMPKPPRSKLSGGIAGGPTLPLMGRPSVATPKVLHISSNAPATSSRKPVAPMRNGPCVLGPYTAPSNPMFVPSTGDNVIPEGRGFPLEEDQDQGDSSKTISPSELHQIVQDLQKCFAEEPTASEDSFWQEASAEDRLAARQEPDVPKQCLTSPPSSQQLDLTPLFPAEGATNNLEGE